MDTCTYSPQISVGGNAPAIPANGPTLIRRSTVIFQYPVNTPTLTLEIRNPNLNNKIVPKISRIQRLSRGNELIIYRDPIWPKQTILNWAFEGLQREEALACLDFVYQTCGRMIKLTDYESRVLNGILMNPKNPISQETGGCRSYTWKMDFQGNYV